MDPVTIENRKAELRTLLAQIQAQPSHDWSRERQRVVVLQQMIAGDEARKAPA
jgi:hypothetical protein